jgi:hypothetical protein
VCQAADAGVDTWHPKAAEAALPALPRLPACLPAFLQKWVGTTECAALLRSFGLRAQIVDFGVRPGQAATGAAAGAAGGSGGGPVPVHPGAECDGCGQFPIRGDRYRSDTLPDYGLCAACHASAPAASGPFRRMMPGALSMAGPRRQEGGPAAPGAAGGGAASGGPSAGSLAMREQLLLWVWRYFMAADDETNSKPSSSGGGANPQVAGAVAAAAPPDAKRQRLGPSSSRVNLSGKPPLYFQVGQEGARGREWRREGKRTQGGQILKVLQQQHWRGSVGAVEPACMLP